MQGQLGNAPTTISVSGTGIVAVTSGAFNAAAVTCSATGGLVAYSSTVGAVCAGVATLGQQGTTAGSLTIAGTSGTNGTLVLNGGTSGSGTISVSATGGTLSLNTGWTIDTSGQAVATSQAAGDVPLSIVGASGQSGNLLNITANGGAPGGIFSIAPNLNITAASGSSYIFNGRSAFSSTGTGLIQATTSAGNVGVTLNVSTDDVLWVKSRAGADTATIQANLATLSGTLTLSTGGIATTPTDTALLTNSTAATSGVPVQDSTGINFGGAAWNTSGTPASNAANCRQYLVPVSGSTVSATMKWDCSIAGGAYSNVLSMDNSGDLTTASGGTFQTGAVTLGTTNKLSFGSRSAVSANVDGQLYIHNNASTGFTSINFGVLTSSGPALTTTIQTNPTISVTDATGGATANLLIPAQAASGGTPAVLCIDSTGKITKGSTASCTGT